MIGRSWVLIGYDIRDPERLRRVGSLMRGYGDRIQYSVFRCRLSDSQRERMLWELAQLMTPEDSLILVPLCAHCYKRVIVKGRRDWHDTDDGLVIL